MLVLVQFDCQSNNDWELDLQKKEGVKIETYRIKEYRRFFCDTHFAIQLASKICKVVKNAFLKE